MQIDAYLQVIRRWLWLIVLMAVVAAGASYVVLSRQPKYYTAQATLLVGPGIDSPASDLVLRASTTVLTTYADLARTRPVMQQVIDDLHLDIGPSKLGGMITVLPSPTDPTLNITVRSTKQKEAIDIANGLANVLVKMYSDKAANTAGPNGTSLDTTAQQYQDQIKQSQTRISQLQAQLDALNTAQTKPPFTDVQNKINQLETQLAGPTDPTTAKAIQTHQARIQQLEAAMRSTVNLDAQRLILDELNREDTQLAALTSQTKDQKQFVLNELSQERNALASMQLSLSQQQNQLVSQMAIERSQLSDAQRNLASLSTSAQTGLSRHISVIDPAVNAPLETSKAPLIAAIAGLAGLVLGLTLAFGFEYFDDRVRTSEQLADATGGQVWASFERRTALLHPWQLQSGSSASSDWRVAEAFRLLCMKLTPPTGLGNVCSLLVANFDREGTAAETAANLALTLARAGKRVFLVDADTMQPSIDKMLQLGDRQGLVDWLGNGSHPSEPNWTRVEWAPGLVVLTAGTVEAHPPEQLAWHRVENLIKRVEGQTDILIVVGPPLALSADSYLLGSNLGGVLAVARRGHTKSRVAADSVATLRSMGIPLLGMILTDGSRSRIKALPKRLGRGGPTAEKLAAVNSTSSNDQSAVIATAPIGGVQTSPASAVTGAVRSNGERTEGR